MRFSHQLPGWSLHAFAVMRLLKPQWPLKTAINMYEHAGPEDRGVKLRDANWLSGVIEQHPASKWRNTH